MNAIPPPMRRKARDAEATREEILKAAMEEFARVGLHGARVEEIAARTATSKHMIYYYFSSKEGLYATVLEKAYAEFRSAESAVDYESLSPEEALRTLIGITFDSHQKNPHVIRLIMSENLDRGRHIREIDQFPQRRLVLETLQRMIERGKADGIFREDIDPLQLHTSLSALCFNYVSNRHTFGYIFAIDYDDPQVVAARREEVIRTLLARCLV
jgi:AcrR family transcriptional regulator